MCKLVFLRNGSMKVPAGNNLSKWASPIPSDSRPLCCELGCKLHVRIKQSCTARRYCARTEISQAHSSCLVRSLQFISGQTSCGINRLPILIQNGNWNDN